MKIITMKKEIKMNGIVYRALKTELVTVNIQIPRKKDFSFCGTCISTSKARIRTKA